MGNAVDNFLAHYGVKGMKWGVIRKSDKPADPSSRQIRATAKYLRKGFDLEVAQKKAAGRIKVENILLATGGVVLAAGAGYVAYRQAERVFGSVNLPMGTPVHHVNVHGPKLNIQDKPMFVSFDKRDQKFYDSVFANFAKNRAKTESIYKSTLKTTTNIKAPSNFQASKLFKEFDKVHKTGMSYADFNYSFNGEGTGSPAMKREFAKFMQGKGYNAMIDNFDTMRSFRTRTTKPTILFDPTRSIKKVDEILLNNDKILIGSLGYDVRALARSGVNPRSATIGLLAGLGVFGKQQSTKRATNARIDAYKKKYPGTKLSDAEIYNLVGYKG